jgi:hypothetical protein
MTSGIGRQDNDSGTGEIIALPGDGSQLGRALLHACATPGSPFSTRIAN